MMRARTASGEDEQIAHVLRRCGFGPKHGDIERWRARGPEALIEALLEDDAIRVLDQDSMFDQFGGGELDGDDVFRALIDQMLAATNPLHERMTWYWHTHFTTSIESSEDAFGWQQHQLIRRFGLGNFRELARAISTDAGMLFYLDGAGSSGDNPNENYAREFLELFTLGRNGGYNEDDVRAAARIFSGWHADWDTGEVHFEPETHYERPVTFMGKRQRWTIDTLIAYICDLKACHEHVVTRLYHHLVGPDLSDARRGELARVFADSGLDIKQLVAAMLRGDDFMVAVHSRTRQPLEWALAALNALGYRTTEQAKLEIWQLEMLGQMPLMPPNVAGWPLDDRWSAPSQVIARTSLLLDWELPESTIGSTAPTVDQVLARCAIFAPSSSTRAALEEIERTHSEFDYRLELLFVSAMTSPEFSLL
ncbi:MAG: DUF1800 domain-containing protein [Acidimicrobiales bacterium]|jgi:uncharacterized protein (DUF1800 family)